MKDIFRDTVVEAFHYSRLIRPTVANRNYFTIITFHRILPGHLRLQYPLPGLVTTPEELLWVLKYFQQHYTCGTVSAMMQKWDSEKSSSKPLMAITFDDAQEDNYRYAVPVLEELGVKGTFFVPVTNVEQLTPLWHDILGFTVLHLFDQKLGLKGLENVLKLNLSSCSTPVEAARTAVKEAKLLSECQRIEIVESLCKKDYCPKWAGMMSWLQLEKMSKNGFEIGSHSMTHPILPKCTDSELQTEIVESRKVLQERLGVPVNVFCYPNGDYDERVLDITQSAGYECAVTTELKTNQRKDSMFQLGRCDIDPVRLKNRNGVLSISRLEWRLSHFKRHLERFGG